MAHNRLGGDTAELWTRFHELVNMTGHELRSWLLTEASGPEGFASDPSLDLDVSGRDGGHVQNQRRRGPTDGGGAAKRGGGERGALPLGGPRPDDETWRRTLMSLGHDPLKPDSPRPGEDPEISG